MAGVLKLVRYGTPAAERALARLDGRLAAMERLDSAAYRARVKRLFGKVLSPEAVVARILADVRSRGDAAVKQYAKRIDGVNLTPKLLKVTAAERKAAYRRAPAELRAALKEAARRIEAYQRRLLPKDLAPAGAGGVTTGLMWSPLRRAGIYVPGGTAAYPSSVLMNVIPAQVAGVKEIALATPCAPDGRLSDGVLCACELLGVTEIYRLGGAQAIGALAYGTRSIPRVDKLVGPGNLFVLLAKRAVFGQVDIDMLAGPSEVLVLAEAAASPRADWIAADLLAQAEHDPLCSCVLVCDSLLLAEAVRAEAGKQLAALPRRELAGAALRDWGLAVVTRGQGESVEVANRFAPEHLELFVKRPKAFASKLTNAGAIFLTPHATEPLGDYLAGPSHTLPTGGTARAFSGVSVYTFLRRTSLIGAGAQGLESVSGALETLAEAEGLEAHRRAVAIRKR
ncbi:MAG: histidinol dehydrogenase [Planctomycetota bacterium]|nr:histidinol dehydrogenase [Planctomycetota bacterium]